VLILLCHCTEVRRRRQRCRKPYPPDLRSCCEKPPIANSPHSCTYTVNADCTGTATYSDGTRYDQFIAPDGSILTFVLTKPSEGVTSAFELQVTAKRVGD
jgi:hypothetical protein